MLNLADYNSFLDIENPLNEGFTSFPRWKRGGILLIKGNIYKNGKFPLYAGRLTAFHPTGLRGNFEAILDPYFEIITKRNGKLRSFHVDENNSDFESVKKYLQKVIITEKSNNFPHWQITICEDNLLKLVENHKELFDSLPIL